MAKEIERKFLVNGNTYRSLAQKSFEIAQGYISTDPDGTVRVRIKGEKGFLTAKTRNCGCVREEWEFEVPVESAREMLAACRGTVISKTRYIVPCGDGLDWEVDEFHGRHEGLVVAEIELPTPDTSFSRPSFIGDEVTGDPAYYNSSLSKS